MSEVDAPRAFRLGIGHGVHLFFFQRRLYWFRKYKLESNDSFQKEEIVVRTFGFSRKVFDGIVDLFNQSRRAVQVPVIKRWVTKNDGHWLEVAKQMPRTLDSLCINKRIKQDILDKLTLFSENKDWYQQKGLTHKISFLFYGPPGTGKTTLCRVIASHFKRDLYILDLAVMTNETLADALGKVEPGGIVLLEDVDQAGKAVQNREKKAAATVLESNLPPLLTLSGVLNAFDGVATLDDIIVFMTSNRPDDLDPALLRKSRMDHAYLIELMTGTEIYEYMSFMYERVDVDADTWEFLQAHDEPVIPGCDIQALFKEHPESPATFLWELRQRLATRQDEILTLVRPTNFIPDFSRRVAGEEGKETSV